MFIAVSAGNDHIVTLEQDGDEVDILVNGKLVAWFVDDMLVTDEYDLEKVGLVHLAN